MSASFLGVSMVVLIAMQTNPAPSPSPSLDPAGALPKPISMTGCITQEAGTPSTYTFADSGSGIKYRVKGFSVQRYRGQRVAVIGRSASRSLVVRGGLEPSPNVAAQAGALNPSQAAVAQMPGGPALGTGKVEVQDFFVMSARLLGGTCR